MNFQQLVLALSEFWAGQGAVIQQPYDLEVGAGTMHPDTFFRVLGPDLIDLPESVISWPRVRQSVPSRKGPRWSD